MKYIKFTIAFFNYLGTRNWYEGVDEPNAWQYVYRWRIGPGTAFRLAKGIHLDKWQNKRYEK